MSATLHLAEAGTNVVLLEAKEIGFGGAGRNVRLVNAGSWLMPEEVEKKVGSELTSSRSPRHPCRRRCVEPFYRVARVHGSHPKCAEVAVHTTYEKGIITRLAEHFPRFRNDLLLIPKRFKDLCAIIRNNFYHPGFHGSFSLKSVLPKLVFDMDYEKLAIQEGNQASFEFLRMIDSSTTPEEKQRVKQELLEYCGYDTLAMVKTRDKLLERF